MTYYMCPVCGYDEMRERPEDFAICPCCATQFDHDDYSMSHRALRDAWVRAGTPWFSRTTRPPADWDAIEQLVLHDLEFDLLAQEHVSVDDIRPDAWHVGVLDDSLKLAAV
jgi:hypothetical protein